MTVIVFLFTPRMEEAFDSVFCCWFAVDVSPPPVPDRRRMI